MTTKIVSLVLSAMLFALCHPGEAQQPRKVFRIGDLTTGEPSRNSFRSETIRLALRKLGYIEGQNIAFEYRYAEGKLDRLPELAADLVRLKADIIVATGGASTIRAATNATKTIPIVMMFGGGDPVEAGLIESLARPGGNVTGLTNLSSELGGTRLELLKEAVPKVARAAVLYDSAIPGTAREVKEDLPVAARALKLTSQPWEVRAVDDFQKIFADLKNQRPDALYVSPDALLGTNQKRTTRFALENRLPSIYSNREGVDAGGLMYYGADATDSYRRVAYYVDRILKGARPANLPVEQPTKVRVRDQSQDGEADRTNDSAQCAGESGQSDSVRLWTKSMDRESV
jgi:putative ABC transport system substrate-binding protein